MKAFILNDTSGFKHPGCDLTMQAYQEQCKRVGIEILGTVKKSELSLAPHYGGFEKADLLIVNGEGSIHHNNRSELVFIASRFPSVLVNAVYDSNIERPAIKSFKYITVRESASYHALMPHVNSSVRVDIVPDLTFHFANRLDDVPQIKDIGLGITDSVTSSKVGFSIKSKTPREYIERLAQHKALVCGRFHAITLAAMLGIPFRAYGSNTHKNDGLMNDMGASNLYAERLEDAIRIEPPKSLPTTITEYVETAAPRMNKMFEYIAGL